MNPRRSLSKCSVSLLVAATMLALTTGPAFAQQDNAEMEEVLVEAPLVIRNVKYDRKGVKTELIELKRRISYADLDLSKHADVIELETRVKDISKEACKMLSDMFPLDTASDTRSCVAKAIGSVEAQLKAAITASS